MATRTPDSRISGSSSRHETGGMSPDIINPGITPEEVQASVRTSRELPKDFKINKAAQFQYGRKSQKATHHFDRTSDRLERGNPDVGKIDLGNIEADRPAEPDDNDHDD